jgi:hypothetical protein
LIEFAQPLRPERIDSLLRLRTYPHETRFSQYSQMSRYGRLSQLGERLHQLSGRTFALSQDSEHLAPRRLGDRGENVQGSYQLPVRGWTMEK